jgi:long-chain acyl-CoA synthetase
LEFNERVERVALALARIHVRARTRVGICAPSSLEWEIVQTAVWRAGGSVVGLDLHYSNDVLAKIIDDLQIEVLVAANEGLFERLPARTRDRLRLEISFESPMEPTTRRRWLTELCRGQDAPQPALPEPHPGSEAVVVFSSGTSGLPKPIAYRHDQLALAIESILDAFSDIDEGSILVCWLPLANLFQRMINLCAMARGATTYIVEDPRAVMEHLAVVKPHLFVGVPRFFEKFHAAVQAELERGRRRGIARWAVGLGCQRAKLRSSGLDPSLGFKLRLTIAELLVLRRIRDAFGSNLRYCISGSAPMQRWLLEWFDAIGLPILEAYGNSENIVPIAANRIADRKLGTVGKPFPGQVVTISDEGEVLVHGPGIATDIPPGSVGVAPTDGNVLATGDLGKIDADGYLTITGRKSDVFKSAAGKWVVPTEIESQLMRVRYVEHAIVFGAGRESNIALLCVSCDLDAMKLQSAGTSHSIEPSVAVSRLHEDVMSTLGNLPSHAQLAGLLILPAGKFSVSGGELTTNLKLRRKHIEEKYAAAIDQLYGEIKSRPVRPVIHTIVDNHTDGAFA